MSQTELALVKGDKSRGVHQPEAQGRWGSESLEKLIVVVRVGGTDKSDINHEVRVIIDGEVVGICLIAEFTETTVLEVKVLDSTLLVTRG